MTNQVKKEQLEAVKDDLQGIKNSCDSYNTNNYEAAGVKKDRGLLKSTAGYAIDLINLVIDDSVDGPATGYISSDTTSANFTDTHGAEITDDNGYVRPSISALVLEGDATIKFASYLTSQKFAISNDSGSSVDLTVIIDANTPDIHYVDGTGSVQVVDSTTGTITFTIANKSFFNFVEILDGASSSYITKRDNS